MCLISGQNEVQKEANLSAKEKSDKDKKKYVLVSFWFVLTTRFRQGSHRHSFLLKHKQDRNVEVFVRAKHFSSKAWLQHGLL